MSTFALISTVAPGPVIEKRNFDSAPTPAKGRKWIPDVVPAYNALKQTVSQVVNVPVDAETVPYTISTIPLSAIRTKWKAKVVGAFAARASVLINGYNPLERETWHVQLDEATAVMADPEAEAPFLEAIAMVGETKVDVATSVMLKADALKAKMALLIANRRALFRSIEDSTTSNQVLAVDVESGWPW